MKKNASEIKSCRICSSNKLYKFLSLGDLPIPNGFLSKGELSNKEMKYPLEVCVCENCSLVQLVHIVSADVMFRNYLYIPSTSSTMLGHFKSLSEEIISNYNITPNSLVVDVGSNDGTLLSFFKEHEIRVLGIDPAKNLAKVAQLKGLDIIDTFFTSHLARKIIKEKGQANVITATNVIAHVDDLHDLCEGVNILLEKEGVFIAEFPYLLDLLDKNEFDTIYHEHLSYFAIRPLMQLFKTHNMHIVDIRRTPVHGGSIRVYVAKQSSHHQVLPIVNEYVNNEILKKLNERIAYKDFARRVKVIRRDLVSYLKRLRKGGKKIIGYGAAAKGNVLLNYCDIGTNLLDYIVDSIPYKQGKYTPGTHIPIYPESRLEKNFPDYILLLAWNFADEILRKQISYREKGGRFIITIPYLRIE